MRSCGGIAWDQFGTVLLVAYRADELADADWAEFITAARAFRDCTGMVVVTGEARLSHSQRAQLQAYYEDFALRCAVITDSLMMRSAIAAGRWFNVSVKAFPPDQVEEAFAYVRLPGEFTDSARESLKEVRQAVYAA